MPARGSSAGAKLCAPEITSARAPAWTPSAPTSRVRRSAGGQAGRRCRRAAARASQRCGCRPARPACAPTRHQRPHLNALGAPAARDQEGAQRPATIARTTSLTVPPNAFLTSLKSSSCSATATKRRCGPIGRSAASQAPGSGPPDDLADALRGFTRAREGALGVGQRVHGALRERDAVRTAPIKPAVTNATAPGSGCGFQGFPLIVSGGGSGERSNSTVARSTPAMPSIRSGGSW